MRLCCLWRWLNLSLEDAALQVPLENLHLGSSYHPPIYNNYCCSMDRACGGALVLWRHHLLRIAHLSQGPLITAPQQGEPNHASEEGGAVPDIVGPDSGEGKRWDTAELLPADNPFLQRVMPGKGSSAPFPRPVDPFKDPFELSLYRHSLF